jgi:hypothetical protein
MNGHTLSVIPFLAGGGLILRRAVRFIGKHVSAGQSPMPNTVGAVILSGSFFPDEGVHRRQDAQLERERGNPFYSDYAFRDYSAVLEEKAEYRSILEKFRVTLFFSRKKESALPVSCPGQRKKVRLCRHEKNLRRTISVVIY